MHRQAIQHTKRADYDRKQHDSRNKLLRKAIKIFSWMIKFQNTIIL